jgi:nitrate reductase molybdenum cofactor assembly chaperone NarJ/NarW
VTGADDNGRLCALLAELLSYPRADPAGAARDAAALAGRGPGREALTRFAAAVGASGLGGLQELYTATFDLRPACAPYLGAQLLPEDSPVRGRLLTALLDLYGAEGFAPRGELADHVAEVVRFLAMARPGPARDDLVADGLLPTLDRMIGALEGAANPYRDLLVAACALLRPERAAAPARRVVGGSP